MATFSTPSETNRSPLIKFSIAMIIFGSVGFFSKRTGLPAIELVFIRCIAAMLFLGSIWLLSGKFRHEVWDRRELRGIILCSLFLILNWVFLFKSIEITGVTVAISLYHLAPLFVMIGGFLLYRESLTISAISAILLCFLGVLLISNLQFGEINLTSTLNYGVIFGILSALFYALLTLMGSGFQKSSAYAITTIQVTIGIFLLLPFVNFSHFNGLTSTNWIYTLLTGFIHTGVVFYLFFDTVRKLPTALISLFIFLDPLVAIMMDLFIDNISLSLSQWVGIFLIFGGMAISLFRRN